MALTEASHEETTKPRATGAAKGGRSRAVVRRWVARIRSRKRPTARTVQDLSACGLAAVLTAAVWMLASVVRGTVPFGSKPRHSSDLYTQFTPFLAGFRDLMTGQSPGDWQFNWYSGLGVPFLPDYTTYLSSPFSILVALFPRAEIETAVYVITVLKCAAAAAAMTIYLRRLRPAGNAWLAALLAVGYGTCGWAVDEAALLPMWLDGLIALPLLALVGQWARQGRRLILSTLVVAVCWWANFYTAYMASIGAVLLTIGALIADGAPRRELWRTLTGFAWRGTLGVGLTAILLWPTFLAYNASQPAPSVGFRAVTWSLIAARFLPLSEGTGTSPGVYAGTVALVLAAALPWHRGVAVRSRFVYVLGLLLVVASLLWAPTQAAWHGFEPPQGSQYRQAFIVAGWLVVAAWVCVADRCPDTAALVAGALTVTAVVVVAHQPPGRTFLEPGWSALTAGVAVAGTMLALRRWHRSGRRRVVVALLALIAVTESVATAAVVDVRRADVFRVRPLWWPRAETVHAVVDDWYASSHGWPAFRMSGAAAGLGNNEPALAGYPGIAYYSSSMPAQTSTTLRDLGLAWSGWGRAIIPQADPGSHPEGDPVLEALLGVTARLHTQGQGAWAVTTAAFPLVRNLPTASPGPRPAGPGLAPGESVFRLRNRLVATPLYEVPTPAYTVSGAARRPHRGTLIVRGDGSMRIRARCTPGRTVQVFTGLAPTRTIAMGDMVTSGHFTGRLGVQVGSGVTTLGTVPDSGVVQVRLRWTGGMRLPAESVGCFDPRDLESQIAQSVAEAPTITASGNVVNAWWTRPVTGDVAISTVRRPGWSCQADGREVAIRDRAGLLTVPTQHNQMVTCSYRTPGLRAGAAGSLTSAALLALIGAIAARRRRTPGHEAPRQHARNQNVAR